MNKFLAFFLVVFLTGLQAFAQIPATSNDQPLEISADGTLEWQRNDKSFIARDNAIAKQGDVSIAASTLTADYRDDNDKNMQIWRVTAEKDVTIKSKDSTAYGEKAVYDIDKGFAVMTGENLRMESPDQVVTAKDSFEYEVTAGRIVANGNARVKRVDDTLEADKISAIMKDDAKGQRVLDSLEAIGNVVITTPTEVATGTHGIYNSSTNKAELSGDVTLTRGPNILKGDRVEVDLNTNTSRMFGNGTDTGRVRGVFYPGSEKKPEPATPKGP